MAQNDKKSKFSIRRLIYNDKYLIIVSLLLALLIWVIASINIGTDENKTIKITAPITLGDELSNQLGMQYYTLQDNIDVSVTISGPKYVIGQVTDEDLSINFDTSTVNTTGLQTVPILVSDASKNLDFDVVSTYPSTIEAYFDVNEVKTFDVSLNYNDDSVADGYTFGTPVLSDEKVVVSGPQTFVDKVERVYANVDFGDENDIIKPFKTTSNLQIEGLGIESNYLTLTSEKEESKIDSVSVTLPVLKKVNLPVSVEFNGVGFNTSDIISTTYSVDYLSAGVLESANVNQAVVGKIDFSKLTVGENKFTFDVTNLQGITVLDDTKKVDVTVDVSSSYRQRSISISRNNVTIEGVPDGYSAKVISIDKSSVSVVAPSSESIYTNDLTVKCDVSTKRDDNTYPLTITVANSKNAWVYGIYNARVELIKQ